MRTFDLRSDTVTRPSPAMREAIARAEVGDDVYGEDPTVHALEAKAAELLGKEAALFVPSGSMGNLLAILSQTERGDEVVAGEGAHLAFYEAGAAGGVANVQIVAAGKGGLYTAADLEAAIKPPDYYHPRTRLVAIENTMNRAGGRVFPESDVLEIAKAAKAHGLALHLDGARLWNAAAATKRAPKELAAPFDTVSVCFSKGLGAPVGSALASTRAIVTKARRFRKMLGAAMRQAGVLAAAALFAIEHNLPRIADDHAAAKQLAEAMKRVAKAKVFDPETNIVNVDTPGVAAERFVERAKEHGVLVGTSGKERVRVVTHLDLPRENVEEVAARLERALDEATRG